MAVLELPHTDRCVVCGPSNPHGLRLHLHVNEETGVVTCQFTPDAHHMGFEGIVHGGLLSTVLDEAMVWAASWHGKRFCVCGELNVRFRANAQIGVTLNCQANVSAARSRLIETTGELVDANGTVVASGWGKYVPVPEERNREFVGTFIKDAKTATAANLLRASDAAGSA